MTSQPQPINVPAWITSNRNHFLPPVCNHFMHLSGQLSVMFVGGANQRRDYHIQEGEELFYQFEGDMVLKVVAQGRKRDIAIKEGEILLLPKRIPHSPQRYAGTLGLVLERKRRHEELDILRFYTASPHDTDLSVLFERSFHWDNVERDMVKVLKEFEVSEEFKTGVPTTAENKPLFEANSASEVAQPFSLKQWFLQNASSLDQGRLLFLFDPSTYSHKVLAYGCTNSSHLSATAETWFYQYEGTSSLRVAAETVVLNKHDSFLLPAGVSCLIAQSPGNYLLSFRQEP